MPYPRLTISILGRVRCWMFGKVLLHSTNSLYTQKKKSSLAQSIISIISTRLCLSLPTIMSLIFFLIFIFIISYQQSLSYFVVQPLIINNHMNNKKFTVSTFSFSIRGKKTKIYNLRKTRLFTQQLINRPL